MSILQFTLPSSQPDEDNISLMQSAWEHDIAKHAQLLDEYMTISLRQTALMERIRLGEDSAKDAGLESVAFEYPIAIDFLSGETDADQLAALDKRVEALKARMRALEGSILTYEPETGDEAAVLLRFVASVVASGHKVDDEYLADVLDRCAHCLDPFWATPVTPETSQLILH